MDGIVELVSSTPDTIRKRNDDDFVDRLSSRYTVAVLIVFALVVSGAAFFGDNITCWAPMHFTGSHTAYANSYCWVRNTYYLDYEEPIHAASAPRQTIRYYQWVPFILVGQAVFFYLPALVWHGLNSRGGIDTDNILETAQTLSHTDKMAARDGVLTLISNQFDRFLRTRKHARQIHCDLQSILSYTLCRPCNRRFGVYLVLLYMFSKLLYIANAIGQLFVLNKVLGLRFSRFGLDAPDNIMSNHAWDDAEHVAFPRVTMCDLQVRRMGNVQRYTVQCALPLNMFNEKIYLFLWFWMVFIAIASSINFIIWFLRIVIPRDRRQFVRNHLVAGECVAAGSGADRQRVDAFVSGYLCSDGCLVLRLIAHNTNHVTTTDIVCSIWESWLKQEAARSSIQEPTTEY